MDDFENVMHDSYVSSPTHIICDMLTL